MKKNLNFSVQENVFLDKKTFSCQEEEMYTDLAGTLVSPLTSINLTLCFFTLEK